MKLALALPIICLLASPACAAELLLLPLRDASTEPDPMNTSKFQIYVRLTEEGRKSFTDFTTEHVGQKIEVVVNARAISPPMRILTPITGGVVVFASVPAGEADQISQEILNAPATFGVELLP